MTTTQTRVKACIIDYGLGNLFSVRNACEHVGMEATISDSRDDLLTADLVILPGVGAFGDAMVSLRSRDLVGPIQDYIASGGLLLGICLGFQLLMTESQEFGCHKGLDIIPGEVVRFANGTEKSRVKVPHVGWAKVRQCAAPGHFESGSGTAPLQDIPNGAFMYFVHSYCVRPEDTDVVAAKSGYGDTEFCSAVRRGNIFACQFHPERSGPLGLQVYTNMAGAVLAKKEQSIHG